MGVARGILEESSTQAQHFKSKDTVSFSLIVPRKDFSTFKVFLEIVFFVTVFLGISIHFKTTGPPLKKIEKYLIAQNFSMLLVKKSAFHNSDSRQIKSFRVN